MPLTSNRLGTGQCHCAAGSGLIPEDLGGYAAFSGFCQQVFQPDSSCRLSSIRGRRGSCKSVLQPHLGVIVLGLVSQLVSLANPNGLPQQTAQQQGGLDDV